jgi:hypothetical protein
VKSARAVGQPQLLRHAMPVEHHARAVIKSDFQYTIALPLRVAINITALQRLFHCREG